MIDLNKIENLNKLNLKSLKIFKPFESIVIDFLQDFSNDLMRNKKNF